MIVDSIELIRMLSLVQLINVGFMLLKVRVVMKIDIVKLILYRIFIVIICLQVVFFGSEVYFSFRVSQQNRLIFSGLLINRLVIMFSGRSDVSLVRVIFCSEIFVFVKVNSGRIINVIYGCRICLSVLVGDLLCFFLSGIIKLIIILVRVV